jgi:hypothetical protein
MVPRGFPPHIVDLESDPIGCDGLGVDSYPSFAPSGQYPIRDPISIGFEGRSKLSSLYVASTSFPVMLYHVAFDIHKGTHMDGEHAILNGVSY